MASASAPPLPAQGFGAGPSPDSSGFDPWIVFGVGGFLVVVAFGFLVVSIWRKERREERLREASLGQIKWVKFIRGDAVESQDDNDDCGICLVEYEDGGGELGVLPCGHRYHSACIKEWMLVGVDRTCPICRAAVSPV